MMKIINQVNEKHDQMMGVYSNRINSVNTIKHWWNKQSNASSAINSLNLQNDIGITMDVINATLAQNSRMETLNHETLKASLPQVMILLWASWVPSTGWDACSTQGTTTHRGCSLG